MKLKNKLIYIICVLTPMFFWGQINISNNLQSSSLAKQNENALYFVDFWATWCKPCITVSKYLESLQKQYPNNFYILSITQENPDLVKRFFEKHYSGLAVAIDYDGETFKENNISSLPYGILYNAHGTKLWEGHPADFKPHHIETFLRNTKKQISVDDMFRVQVYKPNIEKEDVLEKDFKILKLDSKVNNLVRTKHTNYLVLEGALQDILAYSMNVFKKQIQIPTSLNKYYRVFFQPEVETNKNLSLKLFESLGLQQTVSHNTGETIVFNISKPTFWNAQQINWGDNTENFLIGDAEIQADNVTLDKIKYQLATILEMPIVIQGGYVDDGDIHDWQIHYKYFELMASNFYDNYGIKVEKKLLVYPKYIITKKTP